MANFLKYFKSLPQRALDTCLANQNNAPFFQTQIQVFTLETCLFTAEQALRAQSIYPLIYANQAIQEKIGFMGWLTLGTCCAPQDGNSWSTPTQIYIPAEDVLQINSFKAMLAYDDNAPIFYAQKFELWTQTLALHFYDITAEEALKIDTWRKLSHFDTIRDFNETISINEELGWFEYMTTVPTLCATYAYRDAIGDF